MMPTRLLAACVTLLLCGVPFIARAGVGDPRLINGVVEWPAAVTNESFVIVRGDDGVLYYVGIAAARREGAVTAGGRVSVLGLEGRSPHEITAVGVGCARNGGARASGSCRRTSERGRGDPQADSFDHTVGPATRCCGAEIADERHARGSDDSCRRTGLHAAAGGRDGATVEHRNRADAGADRRSPLGRAHR
jgi:hypothetical protein